MNKILYIALSALAAGSMLLTRAGQVYADTIVPETLISVDTTWNKQGSPYILEGNISVVDGASLTIREEVEVRSENIADEELGIEASGIGVNGGALVIMGRGMGEERVRLRDLGRVSVENGEAYIGGTDVRGGGGFSFENSIVTIATSTISGTFQAIQTKDSSVKVWASRIENNRYGIRVEPHQVFQVMRGSFTGGIGNALGEEGEDDEGGQIKTAFTITHSVIMGNERTSMENVSEFTLQSPENWWGSMDGPQRSGANRIIGEVEYSPWLMEEPIIEDLTDQRVLCCSSVLFIPGLQATRLYKEEAPVPGQQGTTTNRLWEPNRHADVRALYLDENGFSTDPTIDAGGVVDYAYGLEPIYGSFLGFLEKLKKEKTIDEWNVFGYDWRKPIAEVVAGRQKRATTSDSLIDTVTELASRSRTGKVSLIAHSNGGLVAKYLVKTLEERGQKDLIDGVISVAVPYLGTPEAIPALLHGDDQAIAQGLFVDKATARGLGKNMPSAYNLLPSREYFSKIFTPAIAFAGSTTPDINNGSYPQKISSFVSFVDFMNDVFVVRRAPAESDVQHPIKGNSLLLSAADTLHGILDPYSWPTTLARWAIVGWNVGTTEALNYGSKKECTGMFAFRVCEDVLTHHASTTMMGDGTVVVPSAGYNAGTVVSVDLASASVQDDLGPLFKRVNFSHANILESSTTQAVLRNMLTHSAGVGNAAFTLPTGASWGEPPHTDEPSRLVVSTHSPVELHLYDTQGRHTGRIASPVGIEEGLLSAYEEAIPDSEFRLYGNEKDPDTYIYLPDHTGQTYFIVIKGTDMGSATLEVERVRGGETLDRIIYADIPVTPLTVASTSLKSNTSDVPGTIAPRLASTTLPVQLDIDGNGSAEVTISPGFVLDVNTNITLIRTTVRTLLGPVKRADAIDKRLVRLAELIKKGKTPKVTTLATKLKKRIGHINPKKISVADKEQIISIIEAMVAGVE